MQPQGRKADWSAERIRKGGKLGESSPVERGRKAEADAIDMAELADPLGLADLATEKAVPTLVEAALRLDASDLIIKRQQDHSSILIKQHGVMRRISLLPADQSRRYVAFIKTAASLDIAERRHPQDGRWNYHRAQGGVVGLRISVLPTIFGEELAIRVLRTDLGIRDIDALGFLPQELQTVQQMLSSSSGLILVTGPSGSGKTTTLYAFLEHIQREARGELRITTIEDPIEFVIDSLTQCEVNPQFNLGFAELLRAVLRQAPDVIMIGEIRDEETAQAAVRAACSGHLVLATLHSPMAAAAIQALRGLGVHPHFFATSLLGIISQRLVRQLDPDTRVSYDISIAKETFDEVRRWLAPHEGHTLYGPRVAGPEETGYVGVTGVFEVLPVNKKVRQLIAGNANTARIRDAAVEAGMIPFRQSALIKVARGVTSTEEVFRVVPSEYLAGDEFANHLV